MDKRTIILDANDISTGFDLATKISNDIFGLNINLGNIDALFDSIFDYVNGMRIVVKNAEKLPSDARKVLDDALENSTGLEVLFEYGDGSIECRTSAHGAKVEINITTDGNNSRKPKRNNWWDVSFSRLVKLFGLLLALGVMNLAFIFLLSQCGHLLGVGEQP